MRKVLSFVLVLTLVLGSFSMAFAATPAAGSTSAGSYSDVAGKSCAEAVRVLSNLGVITGYEDGTFQPEKVVTRAEATVIVIKALGLANSVGTQKSSFTDLSGYGWAEGYIAFATQLGITNGYPDGTFKPGQTVSYNEMATMFVRALGYSDVSLTGTWPAKYVNQASAVGIMDDVTSGGAAGANRGDVAVMANNALTAYIGSVDKDNNWNPIIKSGSVAADTAVYDTMIGRLGGHYVKGVIQDNADATINVKAYVGKYCEYYTDEADGKGNIIAVSKVKSDSLHGEYDSAVTTEAKLTSEGAIFTADDVDYKNDKDVTDDGDVTPQYFRNGESVGWADMNTPADVTDLEVALSGKTIKTLYSVSEWVADGKAKVEAGDLEDIADGSLLGYDFDTDKSDKIVNDSFDLVGVKSLDDIKADNVVFVYPDKDDVIRRVAVGTEVVEGDVTKINSDGDEWTINGTKYSFSRELATAADADGYDGVEAGDTVKVWLDAYGDIYEVESVSGSANDYAIVKDKGSFDSVKLYLATDSTKVFDTDLDSGVVIPAAGTIVGYGLDKDGVIDTLAPENTTDPNAHYFNVSGAGAFLASNKVLDTNAGKTYAVKSDVTVFTFDSSDDSYGVSKIADVDKNEASSVIGYLLKKGDVVAVLVKSDNASGTSEDSYAVISDYASAKNPVGDKAYELTGWINGKKMSDAFTSAKGTIGSYDYTTVGAYKIKYNDDKMISKITAEAGFAPFLTTIVGKTSNDYVSLDADTKYAFADNAAIYEVTLNDDGTVDEYKTFSGTIPSGSKVWLFDTDTDSDAPGYEVVIIDRP